MANIRNWTTDAASNNPAAPDGFPEGMAPSGVNDAAREVMGATRRFYELLEWRNWHPTTGPLPVQVSGTSFRLSGTFTQNYTPKRPIRFFDGANTFYGQVVTSTFAAPNTTVVVTLDSGALTSSLSAVEIGADPTLKRWVHTDNLRGTRIVQRVEATPYVTYGNTTTNIPFDNTIPQKTEGAQFNSVTITPIASTNRLIIEADAYCTVGTSGAAAIMALFQDATADALATSIQLADSSTGMYGLHLRYEMQAGTTSATTFKTRIGASSGTIYINGSSSARVFGGVSAHTLAVTEYEP